MPMTESTITALLLATVIYLLAACTKLEPPMPNDADILDGPILGLTYAQHAQFLAGDIAFNEEIFHPTNGLGPIFVATSCGSCHAGDGKGTPFTTLTRFGQIDSTGNHFLHLGGPQLQNRAIPGYTPESIPAGATFSKFTPPAITGLGYIQYVTDETILSMADPDDADGDGISGVPNWTVPQGYVNIPNHAISRNGKYISRFGKKAGTYDLLHQTVNAYNQDMGITSTFNLVDVFSGLTTDPEVSDKTVRDVVAYLLMLKVPVQRNPNNGQVKNGKTLFTQAKCASCHVPELQTGYSPITAISYKPFYPYTDLLLHDMGSELDDGYTEGSAQTYEWRTPPLWGLGLSPASQGGYYFLLHDGRARSIEEAIQLHGGEASHSRMLFNQMTQADKDDLLTFLKSL